jgi:hypothetical protein
MAKPSLPITGSCLCGAIRYACSSEPLFMGNCHCRDCQKATGAPYISAFGVYTDALSFSSPPKTIEVTAENGNRVTRGFCGDCGTTLFGRSAGMPVVTSVSAATLDDSSWFTPAADLYVSSALPWVSMNPALTKFEKMPQS